MDIEEYIKRYIEYEEEADTSHWGACQAAWDAEQTGHPNWAAEIALWSKQGSDIVRYKRNAWAMWTLLQVLEKRADDIKKKLSYSHFKNAYKFIGRSYVLDGINDTYREHVTVDDVIESLIQAADDELTVRGHEKILDDKFGEKLPEDKYTLRLGRLEKELKYLHGLSAYYKVSERIRKALKELIYELEHEA